MKDDMKAIEALRRLDGDDLEPTTPGHDSKCMVLCWCGHKSFGDFYGAVWLKGKSRPWKRDAWKAYKRHARKVHGKYKGKL